MEKLGAIWIIKKPEIKNGYNSQTESGNKEGRKIMDRFNPWVRKNEKLGNAQAGTFVYSKVNENGISEKHVVDDVAVNQALVPPPGAENAILAGGINVVVELDTDYTAKVEDDGRLRTCELIVRTMVSPLTPGTYGKGAKSPDSNPSSGTISPK